MSPYGRTNVRLQWEVKPVGTSFDGTGLGVTAGWIDTGVAGQSLRQTVSGLACSKTM